MYTFRPGRHGSMSSTSLTELVLRNGQYLTVIRSGYGHGLDSNENSGCGLFNSVTGDFLMGIGGGTLPEYSFMRDTEPRLVRGWRNLIHQMLSKRLLQPTKAVRKLYGDSQTNNALDYGMRSAPMADPHTTES